MLFDLALPLTPVRTEWCLTSPDDGDDGDGPDSDEDDLDPATKAIYDKLVARGMNPDVAMSMAKKAAAKQSDSTDTTRRTGRIALAVPMNLRQDARQKAADEGDAMPDGSFPVRSLDELDQARRAFGRVNPDDRGKVKAFLLKRARALGAGQDVIDAIQAYGTD